MSNRLVLVDGYSVLHAWPKLRKLAGRSLEQRRDALIRVLRQYADHSGRQVIVVFDGYAAKRKPVASETIRSPDEGNGLEVIFSDKGKTADDLIERMVGNAANRGKILVVTSDNLERQTVETLGAQSMSAEVFEHEVEAELKELERSVREHSRPRRLGSVRDQLKR